MIALEPEQAELLCGPDLQAVSPEAAYDRRCALTILGRALERLAEEQRARHKEAAFEAMAPFLDGADPSDFITLGARLGMTPGTVAQAVRRLRLRLKEFVRDEVGQLVGSAEELESELRWMREVWGR